MYHKSRHRACRGFGTGSVAALFSRAASCIRGSPKAGTGNRASLEPQKSKEKVLRDRVGVGIVQS